MNKLIIFLFAAVMLAATLYPIDFTCASQEAKGIESKIVDGKKKNQEMKENLSDLDNKIQKLENELAEINGQVKKNDNVDPVNETKRPAD